VAPNTRAADGRRRGKGPPEAFCPESYLVRGSKGGFSYNLKKGQNTIIEQSP